MAVFIGTNADDALTGGAEDDRIEGRLGGDVLRGGLGDDLIIGNAILDAHDVADGGVDQLFGDEGNDRLLLSAGDTGNGGEGDDVIDARETEGDPTQGATLIGSFGDDLLIGTNGADTISGGAGNDTVSYAHVRFRSVFVDLALRDQDTGAGGIDTLIGIENVSGGGGSDELLGTETANVLRGDASTEGSVGVGDDLLDGRGGRDTASYEGVAGAVTVNLAITGPQNTVSAGLDTLVSIENLLGSDFNDTLTGNAIANRINGGDGDDRLVGGEGGDTLRGSTGEDRIFGQGGDDAMFGGSGVDRMSGGDGNDVMFGELDGDLLLGGAGIDALRGDEGNDIIYGDAGNDNLRGGDGVDRLNGGIGNDTLVGGTARDLLVGGAGADQFQFVAGDLGQTFATADRIADLGTGDRIDLSRIDANTVNNGNQAFTWIGTQGFSGVAGQFRNTGNDLYIGDTDGDRSADLTLVVANAQQADFLL